MSDEHQKECIQELYQKERMTSPETIIAEVLEIDSMLVSEAYESIGPITHQGEANLNVALPKMAGHAPKLAKMLQVAIEAINKSIARADDYGDSELSRPVRDAIKQLQTIAEGE